LRAVMGAKRRLPISVLQVLAGLQRFWREFRKKPGIKSTDEFKKLAQGMPSMDQVWFVSGNSQDDAADPGQGDEKQANERLTTPVFSKN